MQLDQSKSATLPELKVKYPQAPAVVKNAVASREKKRFHLELKLFLQQKLLV